MSSTELERQEEDASVAFAVEREIKQAIRKGREALTELAEALCEFDERHGWLHLGYESLGDWLADPEVTMTMGTYRRLVRTWRKVVVEKRVPADRIRQLDMSKVAVVADAIAANRVLVDDALADVDSLGARDLREKYSVRPKVSNVEQEEAPAEFLPDEMAPTRADAVGLEAEMVEVEFEDLSPEDQEEQRALEASEPEIEVLHGEIVDEEPEVELPAWVTMGALQKSVRDLDEAVGSGATWPRVERRSLEVALEVARAWLSIQSSS